MNPTNYLRFVERNVNERAVRILQQWWTSPTYPLSTGNPDVCIGEWRDVPLEQE